MQSHIWRRRLSIAVFLTLLAALVFTLLRPYAAIDWLRLRDYQPSQVVTDLASQTTMTDSARHYFYLNHPAVESKTEFQNKCPKYDDQTITIGCYIGGQRGIYILSVQDQRLAGVEQVTASHEMLHAAYERLGTSDKRHIDSLLQAYADNGLQDKRVKAALEGYKKSEPGQQLNEMHSMFGTEVSNLPPELESYYSRYFSSRQTVVKFAENYQDAFQSRQDQIDQYDSRLAQQAAIIKNNTQQLDQQASALETERQRLDSLRDRGDIDAYNAGVGPFNDSIASYNELLSTTRRLINQYNELVETRNAIAAQKVELQSAIDSSSLPSSR
jgi:flagellar biosynthesis chaperone FliJ